MTRTDITRRPAVAASGATRRARDTGDHLAGAGGAGLARAASASMRWPRSSPAVPRPTARPLSVGGAGRKPTSQRPGAGLRNLLRKERASMKTRPGSQEGRAGRVGCRRDGRAAARVTGEHPTAGRHQHARVPARPSARLTITSSLSGGARGASAANSRGTRRAVCRHQPSSGTSHAHRVSGATRAGRTCPRAPSRERASGPALSQ